MKSKTTKAQARLASTRLLAEQIVDDIMCRHDGSCRQAIRLMLVMDAATDPHCAGWARLPLIDRIEKHLKANAPLQVLERSDNNLQAEVRQ